MYYKNTLKGALACACVGFAVVAAPLSNAEAQPQFDRKLAAFLADKAAATLGALRQGYAMDGLKLSDDARDAAYPSVIHQIRSFVPQIDDTTTSSIEEDVRHLLPRTDIRIVYAG
ncbi:hypothetical protein [Oricola sp.]|uniref:hypothetical protein n=1 Tax=Oricola sp. TaxID=1979950 RepID=UPI0025CD874E|nr:hypothetical protein [Oricola sp.]MCI5076712.1 hypothetical protein [Oricola sp.]